MSSSDVRDVLNLPTDGAPRPFKKAKSSAPRANLKGLAREVQSLGGDNPIVIAPEVTFRKRRIINKKPAAAWELRPFRNSARDDPSLVLRHWRRKPERAPGSGPAVSGESGAANGDEKKMEDSAFAKYNVKVTVPQYSDDQYRLNLQNLDWTKDETDYLLSLAKEYDLRWPVIWDRYEFVPSALNGETGADGDESKAIIPAPKDRTLEDLKARYYEVASKMMVVQKPEQYMTDAEKNLYVVMSKFDPVSEAARKQYAAAFLERSRDEAKEEESLLVEVRRIMARNERFNEERRELYRRLDYPHTDQDISSFKSSAGLQSLLQNLLAVDKSKKRKSIAPAAADGTSPSTAAQATPTEPTTTQNRRDSIAASSAAAQARRESSSVGPTQTPTAPAAKKGAAAAAEKKKLSQQDQILYGVSHHDRLSSGPTFRTERINRLFSQRSGQMQLRITNVLTELDFPTRLTMPTYNVTSQYERLLSSIISLLDVRKQGDKLDSELKIETQKKALREAETKEAEDEAGDKDKASGEAGEEKASGATAGEAAKKSDASTQAEKDSKKAAAVPAAEAAAGSSGDKPDASAPGAPDAPKEGAEATGGEKDKDKLARPGSSGHKRSASVLSTTSDKSSKRQKK